MSVIQANTPPAQREQLADLALEGDARGRLELVLVRRREAGGGFLAAALVAFDLIGDLLAFAQRTNA